MDGQAIIAVSAAVVALTSLVKWAGLNDHYGPIIVLILSAVGVGMWGYTEGTYERTKAFEYFAGWIAVATSAAGVYGFTRSSPAAVTVASPRSPIPGAFQNPTEKPNMPERRQ